MAFFAARRWLFVHKWTSLICTVFLWVVCLSGLPLIFSQEIGHWLDHDPPYATVPAGTPKLNLDTLVNQARQRYPGQLVTSVFADSDEPQVIVAMVPSRQAAKLDPTLNHWLTFDAHTGGLLEDSKSPDQSKKEQSFGIWLMGVMARLHIDLYARLPGQLFLAFMGLLFVVATVSGIVLYGPFMKKLDFGTVRDDRSKRLKWLDLHNLLGVAVLAWMLVVGATGVLNELAGPLFQMWMATDVRQALAPWQGTPIPDPSHMSSVQGAYDAVRAALPGKVVESLTFPNDEFGSPHHYLLWTKGDTPLTSRLFNGALVDARTGQLSALLDMPWYLRALQVSRPLHFGDYGGLPLKIIWALLDGLTLIVLGSGIYLWVARRTSTQARLNKLMRAQAGTPACKTTQDPAAMPAPKTPQEGAP